MAQENFNEEGITRAMTRRHAMYYVFNVVEDPAAKIGRG